MADKNKTSKVTDEMRKKIAAYEQRRKRRMDGAGEAQDPEDLENADTGDESAVAGGIKDNANEPPLSAEERLDRIKGRRDRRDAEGSSDDPEAAKATIAEQDEDIQELIKIIEELQAAADISAADNGGVPDENVDEGEPAKPAEGGKIQLTLNADGVDEVVAERLRLGRIGDKLNLDELETLKPLEAKKRIIKAIKPDLRLDGKSKHYVNTAFDIAVQELNVRKNTDYQKRQMFNTDGNNVNSGKSKAQQARDKMLSRMNNRGGE